MWLPSMKVSSMKAVKNPAEAELECPLLNDGESDVDANGGESEGEIRVANGNINNNNYHYNNIKNNNNTAKDSKKLSTKQSSLASKESGSSKSAKWSALLLDRLEVSRHKMSFMPKSSLIANEWHTVCTWSAWKRKLLFGLLALSLFVLFLNSYLLRGPVDERIQVLHYSHVPGMKEPTQVHLVRMTSSNSDSQKSADLALHLTMSGKSIPATIKGLKITNKAAGSTPTLRSTFALSALPHKGLSSVRSGTFNDTFQKLTSPHPSEMPPPGYLVWSDRCKMPNIDPYLPEVMEYFERQKYEPCSTQQPLTRVEFLKDTQRYALVIIKERIRSYSKTGSLDCCYQVIKRNHTGKSADRNVSLSKCVSFRNGTQLPPEINNIMVKCKSISKQVYISGHAMMPERKEIRQRLSNWQSKEEGTRSNATSVLMIGIDSISRINLIRAMPKTAQYLYDNEWFEMSGYNKIDDNTFPNLMAVLTGRNRTNAFKKCSPNKLHGLDDCPFIWKTFRDHGYVTAYAEDEASINTFNYLKLGFVRPPVDYYLRPFLLSAEKLLPIKRKSSLSRCVGYQNSADYVYNYALELATRYEHDPYFGLFWTNTFSHNAISDCSAMDIRMEDYLRQFAAVGTLKNAIVIFLSDHGLRFGPTRKTLSGHLEERLPFMFIWLPPHLKHSHPEFVNALSVNKNRLTNPYDLHMTLKHVLALSGRVKDPKKLAPAEDCARCQTLLTPVSHNRSCEDIAIEEHWCTCIPYQSVYKNSKTVQKMAQGIVKYINDFVSHFRNGSITPLCQTLHLGGIDSAYRAQPSGTFDHSPQKSLEIYRINFNTRPNQALYEATVRYNVTSSQFEVTGEISRLDAYAKDSQCISDGAAKKFCSCRKKLW